MHTRNDREQKSYKDKQYTRLNIPRNIIFRLEYP